MGNGVTEKSVLFVFKKTPRQPQKYGIKYYEGTVMESIETDIEMAPTEEQTENETSSVEREEREDREQLGLEDRDEDDDEDTRHPLDREENEEEDVAGDGNAELNIVLYARERKANLPFHHQHVSGAVFMK